MKQELDFDETVTLAAKAAQAHAAYPGDLAGMVGEMTLWLERHRLPGLQILAQWLENAPQFNADTAGPRVDDDGSVHFNDPFVGGMFIVDQFDTWTLPGMFEGPEHGTALMIPFLAMAAHQRAMTLEIVLFGTNRFQGEAGRLSYRDGASSWEGKGNLLMSARRIGISRPEFLAHEPKAPLEAVISVDQATIDRLTPRQSS